MCLSQRNLNPKARRFLVIGNLCLSASLVLSIFCQDLGLHRAAAYNALRGFLLGLAIAFNFAAMRIARSQSGNRA